MNLNEKIAYIRGLAEGLNLDQSKDEIKVLNAIIELLDDMSFTVTQMEDLYDELSEQIDAVDEDLSYLEDDFYEDYDEDECDDDCDCGCCGGDDEEKDVYYDVTCPTCGETISVSEDVLLCGEINCPKCGETLEFDFSELEDEECDCDECAKGEEE